MRAGIISILPIVELSILTTEPRRQQTTKQRLLVVVPHEGAKEGSRQSVLPSTPAAPTGALADV